MKRDEFFRDDCPCKLCSFHIDGETKHEDGKHCKLYLNWFRANSMKSNLANPVKFSDHFDVVDECSAAEEKVDTDDFLEKVDREMPIQLRPTYLKMKSGVPVSHRDKQKVLEFLKQYSDM